MIEQNQTKSNRISWSKEVIQRAQVVEELQFMGETNHASSLAHSLFHSFTHECISLIESNDDDVNEDLSSVIMKIHNISFFFLFSFSLSIHATELLLKMKLHHLSSIRVQE